MAAKPSTPAIAAPASRPRPARVDVVLPVFNEEADLERSVLRLRAYLESSFPFSFRITIADNASTDTTWAIAQDLQRRLTGVRAVHLDAKGRGRALAAVWSVSDADVLVYMDVDLSTDLAALLPLVAPLVSGHSDVAIGTRLAHGAAVVRGAKRELISRCYNLVTRLALGSRFSDAQCGFKAIRAETARRLLPLVEDTGWFFDTELLVLAERAGLRIHEVPVDWVDDPDSRVDIVPTAFADLTGIARLSRALSRDRLPLGTLRQRRETPGPGGRAPRLLHQLVSFGLIGVASTLAYAALYLLLRRALSAQCSNALALLVTAIANTAANRRFTFAVRGAAGNLVHQTQGLVVFALGLAVTSGSLVILRPLRALRRPQAGARRAHRRQRGRHAAALRPLQDVDLPPAASQVAGGARGSSVNQREDSGMTAALRRLWRGRPDDPSWVRPALVALLTATALLYLIGLGRSGWANAFYSAAVQAGTRSWKAFFFGSSDAANFITVDKPPASLWVMELAARIFGVNAWSILAPQALEGVATVGLLYAIVRRWFTPAAGLLAGAVLALTPVATLMFRFNNPDALLVFLLTLAAWAVTRALERASGRWLMLAAAFVGFAFITKMLQAFLVVPVFVLVYMVAAPTTWRHRIWHIVLAAVTMLASAGWWVAAVTLWPAASRPYIGGSQHNSVLELIFGYNGFGRLTGNETGSVVPGGGAAAGTVGGAATSAWGPTGWSRMFNSSWGGQIAWLLPAALVFFVALLWLSRRAPRSDRTRAVALLWGGTLLVTIAVFSFGKGIIHEYYAVALAPSIGALVGVGAPALWARRKHVGWRLTLAAALAGTAAWSFVLLDRSASWHPWLRVAVLVGGLATAAALVVAERLSRRAALSLAGAGVVVALAGPGAYSLQTAGTAHSGSLPTAGPAAASRNGFGRGGFRGRLGGGLGGRFTPGGTGTSAGKAPAAGQAPTGGQGTFGQPPSASSGAAPPAVVGAGAAGAGPAAGDGFAGRAGFAGGGGATGGLLDASTPSAALVAPLEKDAGSYTWVAATVGAQSAAGYQLATDDPVMSLGGFNGSDPYPTLALFESLVAAGKVHYFIAGGMGGGGNGFTSTISSWVAAHFKSKTVGGITLYDLTSPRSSPADSASGA